jgi:hypothetical protein
VIAKLRARLTYANVVATLALFVALGGSSYAALSVTGKNVKNSSLTGKDVKNNSLTGADVKSLTSGDVANGRLLAEDFAPGQLPRGEQGLKGDKGSTGDRGPSDGYAHDFLTLPAGDYVINARVYVNNGSASSYQADCNLEAGAGSTSVVSLGAHADVPATSEATLPLVGSASVPSGTDNVNVTCGAPPSTGNYSGGMTAVRVATLH